LINVPAYDGVLIHIGNTANDTDGCILVGKNTQVGKVLESTATFKALYAKLQAAKGDIYITIRRTNKLREISEWARENLGENVIICQPC
jgi:hypothetical protein